MEFVPLLQMIALVWAFINFLKAVRNGDLNAWSTQLIIWVAGVLVVLLVAQTDFAEGINVGDWTLATLNMASLIFVGLSIASMASVGNELKKAFDASDSAKTPPLVTSDPPKQPQE